MLTDVCGSVYTQLIQHIFIADPHLSGFALLTSQNIQLDYCRGFL